MRIKAVSNIFVALSIALTGCIDPSLLGEEANIDLNLISHGNARLGASKFRLMASSSARNEEVASARILITGMDVRAVDGSFFSYAVDPYEMDLMDFQNYSGLILARVQLPPGEYDLVRLHTAEKGEAILVSGGVLPLIVPSGESSGLKVFFNPSLKIAEGSLTIGVAAFDLHKSFVIAAGNTGKVLFKPVLRVSASAPIIVTPPAEDDGEVTPPAVLPDDGNDDVFMPWIGV